MIRIMAGPDSSTPTSSGVSSGYRLVRLIVLETVVVAIGGLLIWGVAWEIGFPTVGLVIAIVIWLTVSPIIEIATVLNYRGRKE